MTSQAPLAMALSKLMQRGPYESTVDLEKELQQSFSGLQTLSHSSANTPQLPQALLYAILTSPTVAAASSYLHQLTAITAVTGDGYAPFVSLLLRLVNEYYSKLLDQPRNHVLWLVRQLISFNATDIDSLCLSLLRQVCDPMYMSVIFWSASSFPPLYASRERILYGCPILVR